MTRRRAERALAWLMFAVGIAGFVGGITGLVGKGEPPFVLALSWAAVWTTGLVAIIAAASRFRWLQRLLAWLMFTVGIAGGITAATGHLAPREPRLVHVLSWAAFVTAGLAGIIAAEGGHEA